MGPGSRRKPGGVHRALRRGAPLALAALAVIAVGCASPATGPSEEELARHKARIHYDLGVEHLAHNRTALAIRELRQAASLDPADPWIQLALAEGYRRKGRLEETEAHLRRALELDPEFQAAMLNLSALYIQLGRHAEAVPLAAKLADDPTFPSPWRALTNLGWAELQLGHLSRAREHLELAIEYDPTYWPALLDLGILEAKQGNRLEALRLFERVLEQEPGPSAEAEAHYRMAEIYVSLGQRRPALQHLTAAQEKRPGSQWARRSAEYLKLLR